MKFIELTQYDPHGIRDGKQVAVNLEQVTRFEPNGDGTHIIFGTGNYIFTKESYREVLAKINGTDSVAKLKTRPTPYHEQKIVSATAYYTGGGIWNYFGKLESGMYFMAFDCDCYDILILDMDADEAGEDAYNPDWQYDHTVHEYIDCEAAETLSMFKRIYESIPDNEFIDKADYIAELERFVSMLNED